MSWKNNRVQLSRLWTWIWFFITHFGCGFQILCAVWYLTEKPEFVVVQNVNALMVGPQIVHLLFVHARPKICAYEFQDFQLFLIPRQFLRYPAGQTEKKTFTQTIMNMRPLYRAFTSRSDASRRSSPSVPVSIRPRPKQTARQPMRIPIERNTH